MKKKICFILTNLILVVVIALVFGFTLIKNVTDFNGVVLGYITLLVTLCVPSILFIANKSMNSPLNIGSLIFIVANTITSCVFMSINVSLTIVIIVEGILFALYIAFLMILIAIIDNK